MKFGNVKVWQRKDHQVFPDLSKNEGHCGASFLTHLFRHTLTNYQRYFSIHLTIFTRLQYHLTFLCWAGSENKRSLYTTHDPRQDTTMAFCKDFVLGPIVMTQ